MKKIILIIACLSLFNGLFGQNISLIKPTKKNASSFAIVIDNTTFDKISKSVYEYRDAVQNDGLSTYILKGDWTNPDLLRDNLKKLYKKDSKLEGIVLIGDIPVVMVRKAQHMTTAFKMDEEKFDRNESSVCSDRFYDDLNLEFDYIRRDSIDTDFFYYNLKPDCAQKLNPTYYSGRIKFPRGLEGDKYTAIADFLKKAVEAKQENNILDNVVTFAGHGYNSDCLIAWQDENFIIKEQFPYIKNDSRNLKQLSFRMDKFMKYRLFDELQRPEVDAFFFNEHGSIDKQHISGPVNPTKAEEYLYQYKWDYGWIYHYLKSESKKRPEKEIIDQIKKEYHLTDKFFEDYYNDSVKVVNKNNSKKEAEEQIISLNDITTINPQPRFVIFNACYNGSFHRKGSIASYYIFSDGKTVATLGNTVNVLQDKYTYECIGILSEGCRIGQFNKIISTLEGHLIGDPTFHFKTKDNNSLCSDLSVKYKNNKIWREYLSRDNAIYQAIAIRQLSLNKDLTSKEILNIMRSNKYGTVRMECLKQLSIIGGDDFIEGIKTGFYDSYEYVRRSAASYAGDTGDERLIPSLIDIILNYPESQRVIYNAGSNLFLFPKDKLLSELNKNVNNITYLEKDSLINDLAKSINERIRYKEGEAKAILDKNTPFEKRKSAIRSTRNYNYHDYALQFVNFINDKENDVKLKVIMAEALGWYNHSVKRLEIIKGLENILKENKKNLDKNLSDEIVRTINRLKK